MQQVLNSIKSSSDKEAPGALNLGNASQPDFNSGQSFMPEESKIPSNAQLRSHLDENVMHATASLGDGAEPNLKRSIQNMEIKARPENVEAKMLSETAEVPKRQLLSIADVPQPVAQVSEHM